ncbi:DUF3995 domain-containing protein [Streptomyces sp. NPDC051976]|uniref:DUF3995 domain-containing protein n=1 Tax=Streptomyces sp. NPDC051976 TaxID=3154947 RepID=UPI0034266E62
MLETTRKTQTSTTHAAATAVATVLTADGLMHLFWATRAGWWPAHDARTLSLAVLGKDVPFTPPILLPLATVLFCGAGVVVARARLGRGHRFGRVWQAGTVAVACGVSARALAGMVWALGSHVGLDPAAGDRFRCLNTGLYTPLCAALAVAAVTVLRGDDPIRG